MLPQSQMYSVFLWIDQGVRERAHARERERERERIREGEKLMEMCGWRPNKSQRYKHDEGLRSEETYLHSPGWMAEGEKMKT